MKKYKISFSKTGNKVGDQKIVPFSIALLFFIVTGADPGKGYRGCAPSPSPKELTQYEIMFTFFDYEDCTLPWADVSCSPP